MSTVQAAARAGQRRARPAPRSTRRCSTPRCCSPTRWAPARSACSPRCPTRSDEAGSQRYREFSTRRCGRRARVLHPRPQGVLRPGVPRGRARCWCPGPTRRCWWSARCDLGAAPTRPCARVHDACTGPAAWPSPCSHASSGRWTSPPRTSRPPRPRGVPPQLPRGSSAGELPFCPVRPAGRGGRALRPDHGQPALPEATARSTTMREDRLAGAGARPARRGRRHRAAAPAGPAGARAPGGRRLALLEADPPQIDRLRSAPGRGGVPRRGDRRRTWPAGTA